MKKILALLPVIAFVFAACSGGGAEEGKKLMVISSGKFSVDEKDNKHITWEPGGQHNEMELLYGKDKVTVTVKTPDGDKTFDITDNGTWLLNLKKDTVVGGLVNYSNKERPSSITSEELDRMIDSAQKLMLGQNTSDEKKTYFIPPMTIKKISTNTKATILSPYKLVPYEVAVDEKGNAPESYKFFTNTQKREELDDVLKRMGRKQ